MEKITIHCNEETKKLWDKVLDDLKKKRKEDKEKLYGKNHIWTLRGD